MKVVAIIPARYASTRFPGKVLVPINGKPMIQWVWERASMAEKVDEVMVATDDERVAEAVSEFGGRVVMTSDHHQSGTDRVAEAAAKISADVIINLQGDEPLIHPDSLDLVAEPLLMDEDLPMSTLMRPISSRSDYLNPNVVKVVRDEQGNAMYFSRSPLPAYRVSVEVMDSWKKGQGPPKELVPAPMKHVGIYGFNHGFLQALASLPRTPLEKAESLEQLRVLEWGFRIRVVETPHESVGVDVPEDVKKVKALLKKEKA